MSDLEAHSFQHGVDTGLKIGRNEGFEEGEKMGYAKGYALAAEVGFYLGALDMLSGLSDVAKRHTDTVATSNAQSIEEPIAQHDPIGMEKIKRTLEAIRSHAHQFTDEGTLKLSVLEDLHTIRSKFKLVCSQMGMKLRFTGTTVDKVSSEQVPAGMPSVDF